MHIYHKSHKGLRNKRHEPMNCVTHFCNHDGFANAINFKVVHLCLSTLIQFIMSMVRMLDVNSEIGVHVLDSVF